MQDTAFTVWQNISGSGMLLGLYACAVCFLFFQEKVKFKRLLLVYLPALWIGVLLLPFTYELVAGLIDEELYYRFFWMLPVSLVIAYAAVKLYYMYKGKYKYLAALGMVLVILLSGDFVYNNWRYSKAENVYHIPDTVVEICDFMHAEGREVMAVFPVELLQYVRQYDSTIGMPYGRSVMLTEWTLMHPLYGVMRQEIIDGEALGLMAKQYGCVYIVLQEEQKYTGDLSMHGYEWKENINGYDIYYSDEMFWSIYGGKS